MPVPFPSDEQSGTTMTTSKDNHGDSKLITASSSEAALASNSAISPQADEVTDQVVNDKKYATTSVALTGERRLARNRNDDEYNFNRKDQGSSSFSSSTATKINNNKMKNLQGGNGSRDVESNTIPSSSRREEEGNDNDHDEDKNIEEENRDESIPLLIKNDSHPNNRKKKKKQSRPHGRPTQTMNSNKAPFSSFTARQTRCRASLLATSLTLSLGSFWLFDSLKDPVFTILVSGNLKKHQPLAKMCSVCSTLAIVIFMEYVARHSTTGTTIAPTSGNEQKRRRRRKKGWIESLWYKKNTSEGDEYDERLKDAEVLSGGGVWTKMNVLNSYEKQEEKEEEYGQSNERISITTFYKVGISYIVLFGVMALILRLHPDLDRSLNSTLEEVEEEEQMLPSPVSDPFAQEGVGNAMKEKDEDDVSNATAKAWHILAYILYATIESFGSISVATFWSFTNSTLTLSAANAYYGFIIACAQLGAIFGSTVAASSKTLTVPMLFGLGCIGIKLQMLLMVLYGRLFPYPMISYDEVAGVDGLDGIDTLIDSSTQQQGRHRSRRKKKERSILNRGKESDGLPFGNLLGLGDNFISGNTTSGIYLILRHNYLLLILGVSCLYEVSLTCLDYEMKLIGLDRFSFSSDEVTGNGGSGSIVATTFAQFMARYGQLTNALSLLLSYFAFPSLMGRYGLKNTLRIFPTLLVIVTVVTYAAVPRNLIVLFVSVSLLKAMTYSVNDPAKEILYLPTSDVIKYRAKFWIDVVGARIAKAIGSSINTYAGSVDRIVRYGSVPSVVTALALWMVCYKVGIIFDQLIQTGEIVGLDDVDEACDETKLGQAGRYRVVHDNFDRFNGRDHGDRTLRIEDEEDVGMPLDESHDSFLSEDNDDESDSGWESNATIELVNFR